MQRVAVATAARPAFPNSARAMFCPDFQVGYRPLAVRVGHLPKRVGCAAATQAARG